MRQLLLLPLLLGGCSDRAAESTPEPNAFIQIAGRLENKKLNEASGLTRSLRRPGAFWVINDDGPPDLYAIDSTGKHLGKVRIDDASNKDWEDLASFELGGTPYLVVGAIGDNDARRKKRRLYVVKEPTPDDKKVEVEWRIDFTYNGGPRDAEALAVDVENERVLLLSKREVPAVLYELPLRTTDEKTVTATRLGPVASLPQPSKHDLDSALLLKDWHWQPTAMDVAPDNRFAIILTYTGVYYYERGASESWLTAFGRPPLGASLGRLRNAESLAISHDGRFAYVTGEIKHAPLVRYDLTGINSE